MTRADYFGAHVMEPSDGCRIWPFAKSKGKYGVLLYDGMVQRVNILTCLRWSGPPPTPGMDAAHTCGDTTCWAGEHLTWKTRRENLADRIEHGTAPRGTRNPNARLTEDDVRVIRARVTAGEQHKVIARDYGVDRRTIYDIRIGNTWLWLDNDETTGAPRDE